MKTGFPGGSDGKKICLQCRRAGFNPWVRKIPWEKGMATHSSILAWTIPWTEESGSCSPWGHKELDTTERLNNDKGIWTLEDREVCKVRFLPDQASNKWVKWARCKTERLSIKPTVNQRINAPSKGGSCSSSWVLSCRSVRSFKRPQKSWVDMYVWILKCWPIRTHLQATFIQLASHFPLHRTACGALENVVYIHRA